MPAGSDGTISNWSNQIKSTERRKKQSGGTSSFPDIPTDQHTQWSYSRVHLAPRLYWIKVSKCWQDTLSWQPCCAESVFFVIQLLYPRSCTYRPYIGWRHLAPRVALLIAFVLSTNKHREYFYKSLWIWIGVNMMKCSLWWRRSQALVCSSSIMAEACGFGLPGHQKPSLLKRMGY